MRALLLLGLTGCFGEGPEPTSPSGVSVVFHVDQRETACGELASYIGDVGFGSQSGYAMTFPYLPPQSCNGGGDNSVMVPVEVFQFAKNGMSSMKIGEAGFTG